MDLQCLITFRTIVSAGGFVKAANQLGFTQSTVTFQMKRLEQELSVQLFEKIGRSMRLTDAGKRILPLADEVIGTMQKMREITKSERDVSGELIVAISETLLAYKMQEVLRFYKLYAPQVKLTFLSKPCFEIAESLKNGTVDIGILYHVGTPQSALQVNPLFHVPMALVASRMFDTSLYDFTKADQAIHTSFFINEPKCVFREIFEAYLRAKNITIDGMIELGSIETIRKSVANNLGISYLPMFIVGEDIKAGILQELPMDDIDAQIYVAYACHKNKWISPAMELFIKQIVEHVYD